MSAECDGASPFLFFDGKDLWLKARATGEYVDGAFGAVLKNGCQQVQPTIDGQGYLGFKLQRETSIWLAGQCKLSDHGTLEIDEHINRAYLGIRPGAFIGAHSYKLRLYFGDRLQPTLHIWSIAEKSFEELSRSNLGQTYSRQLRGTPDHILRVGDLEARAPRDPYDVDEEDWWQTLDLKAFVDAPEVSHLYMEAWVDGVCHDATWLDVSGKALVDSQEPNGSVRFVTDLQTLEVLNTQSQDFCEELEPESRVVVHTCQDHYQAGEVVSFFGWFRRREGRLSAWDIDPCCSAEYTVELPSGSFSGPLELTPSGCFHSKFPLDLDLGPGEMKLTILGTQPGGRTVVGSAICTVGSRSTFAPTFGLSVRGGEAKLETMLAGAPCRGLLVDWTTRTRITPFSPGGLPGYHFSGCRPVPSSLTFDGSHLWLQLLLPDEILDVNVNGISCQESKVEGRCLLVRQRHGVAFEVRGWCHTRNSGDIEFDVFVKRAHFPQLSGSYVDSHNARLAVHFHPDLEPEVRIWRVLPMELEGLFCPTLNQAYSCRLGRAPDDIQKASPEIGLSALLADPTVSLLYFEVWVDDVCHDCTWMDLSGRGLVYLREPRVAGLLLLTDLKTGELLKSQGVAWQSSEPCKLAVLKNDRLSPFLRFDDLVSFDHGEPEIPAEPPLRKVVVRTCQQHYTPGEVVSVFGWVRKRKTAMANWEAGSGTAGYTLELASGTFHGVLEVTSSGCFHSKLQLDSGPDSAGEATLTVFVTDAEGGETRAGTKFSVVSEFPLEASASVSCQGADVHFKATFGGEPVTELTVDWHIIAQTIPFNPVYYSGYHFSGGALEKGVAY